MADDVAQTSDMDLPDTNLFWRWVGLALRRYAGWIFVGAGILAIFLGWFGVSGQAIVAKQLPYLTSGGIFGLALVAVGTFYLVTEDMRRGTQRIERLERMVEQLHSVLLARPDAPKLAEYSPESNGSNGSSRLVALANGSTYHRAGCRMVDNKPNVNEVTPAAIRRRRLEPCAICEPAARVTTSA
jgi:hypothetical protein